MGTCACIPNSKVDVLPITLWSKMSCHDCDAKFNVFRKKRLCQECGNHFCGNCMRQDRGSPDRDRLRCRCCRIFGTFPLNRIDVAELKVRDLKSFLVANKIPMDNCKEKVDLVDLIMHHTDLRHCYPQNFERHTVRPEVLADERNSPVRRSPGLFHAQPQDNQVNVEDVNSVHSSAGIDGEQSSESNVPQGSNTDNIEVQMPMEVPLQEQLPEDNQPDAVSEKMDVDEACSSKGLSINDIKTPEEIERLTVLQLKLLLARNFISFKGCCEKQELQEKVRHLWEKKQENKDLDKMTDENLCKICFQAAIDSVLLDCGHVVSCTDCGKLLSECPICRQYVVRVVHIFRA